jgi:hypothetical protein
VLTAGGEPFDGNVHVSPSDRSRAIVDSSFPRRGRADRGRFEFDGLAPAEYVVQAATSRLEPPIEGEFGAVFVRIESADVDDVVIGMSRGSTITGQVTFDDSPPPSPEGFELTAESVDPDLTSFAGNPVAKAEPRDDWTFEMGGLNGPRRLRLAAAPAGWIVKAVLVNGIDMTDRPLPFGTKNESLGNVEVVVTNRSAEVAGVVTDADRGTADGANAAGGRQGVIVVAFPVDRARWYPHSGLVVRGDLDRNGAFVVRGVRPGEYYVAAVDARAATDRYEGPDAPDFLEWAVAAATRVTLTPDQRATITLRTAR